MKHFFAGLISLAMAACATAFAPASRVSEVVAPEPGSVFLMATGLAGAAGYLYWKRRRKH